MGILAKIFALFSSSGALDAALRVAERRLSKDATDSELMEFALDYIKETKHQSIPRRVFCFTMLGLFVLFCVTWWACAILGNMFDIEGALATAGLMKVFIGDNLSEPVGYVGVFYFAVHAVNGFKGR